MEQPTTGSLGQLIRLRRSQLGLTQEQLAERVGALGDATFCQTDVSRLERGRVSLPRRERLARLAEALDLPLGELLARSGWTGAERVDWQPVGQPLPAPESEVAANGVDAPEPAPFVPPTPSVTEDIERLHAVIAHSRELHRQTQELLARMLVVGDPAPVALTRRRGDLESERHAS